MLSVDSPILSTLLQGCNALFSSLPAALANARSLLELEHKLRALVLEFGRCVLESLLLAWLAVLKPMSLARRSERLKTMRCKGRRSATLESSFGPVHVETSYFVADHSGKPGRRRSKRGPAGGGGFPALETLGIHDHATPALREIVAREVVTHASVQDAHFSLRSQGLLLDPKRLWALTYGAGEDLLTYRCKLAHGLLKFPFSAQGKRLVLSLDGGRVRTHVPNAVGRRRKNGRRGFDTPWREPKCFLIYEVDAHGQRAPGGLQIAEGSFDNSDDVFILLRCYLQALQIQKAKQILIVADGAEWIWKGILKLLKEKVLPEEKVLMLVDFYHATEYIAKICPLIGASVAQRKGYFKQMKRGEIEAVLKAFKAQASNLKGEQRLDFYKALMYLESRVEKLNYQAAREEKLPLGSGAMESLIRRTINLRLKGNSIYWKLENAEKMLALRIYLKTGRWSEFVHQVIAPQSLCSA